MLADEETEETEVSKKRTPAQSAKPKRVLTEKQKEVLKIARENWQAKRRELKAQKMLTVAPQKERFDRDKKLVEIEINKLKTDIEEKLKMEYEKKLVSIKEEYETKFSEAKAKEEIKVKYTKKPKKIIEVYSTEAESDTSSVPIRPPIAQRKKKDTDISMSIQVDDDIQKFFF